MRLVVECVVGQARFNRLLLDGAHVTRRNEGPSLFTVYLLNKAWLRQRRLNRYNCLLVLVARHHCIFVWGIGVLTSERRAAQLPLLLKLMRRRYQGRLCTTLHNRGRYLQVLLVWLNGARMN